LCFKFHIIWISFYITLKLLNLNHYNYYIILIIFDEISNDIQVVWNLKYTQFIELTIYKKNILKLFLLMYIKLVVKIIKISGTDITPTSDSGRGG
jgi:hypothetical protein